MQKALLYSLPLLLIGSIILLARQFRQFGLMWKMEHLIFAALALLLVFMLVAVIYTRNKYGKPSNHVTELALVAVSLMPTCLLAAYWVNQWKTSDTEMQFSFVSEQARISAPMGLMKNEKRNKRWKLTVKTADDQLAHFSYEGIPRFPLTQPGEPVTLPMRCGLLGTCTFILPAE